MASNLESCKGHIFRNVIPHLIIRFEMLYQEICHILLKFLHA